MTALRSFAFNVAFYVNIIVLMIVGLPLVLFGRHGVFFMARLWSGSSLWLLDKLCGLKVEFRGVENIPQGGYILAAKHQSFLETFALLRHARDFAIIFKTPAGVDPAVRALSGRRAADRHRPFARPRRADADHRTRRAKCSAPAGRS